MGELLNILIIEPSYLVREGLKTLLTQTGLAFRVEETTVINGSFQKLIEKYQPRLVFINALMLHSHWHGNRNKAPFLKLQIVGLTWGDVPETILSHCDFVLDIAASKAVLMQNFVQFITKLGLINNEKDSESISERESDVLRLVALGYTNNEISERLFISVHTVMTHRKNITRKLGIKTVAGLTVYSILNKLVESGELKGRISESNE